MMFKTSTLEVLVGLYSIILKAFLSGIAMAIVWGWLVVPILHLPYITWIQAISLNFVALIVIGKAKTNAESEHEKAYIEARFSGEFPSVWQLFFMVNLELALSYGGIMLFGWTLSKFI